MKLCLIFILFTFMLQNIGINGLMCHRKACTNALECMQGWDSCADQYCYMIRARNITNPMQFNLRRGCMPDPAEIRYSSGLKPFTMLNQCQRIIWQDLEFLLKICADVDYCNFCDTWTEAMPVKGGANATNLIGNSLTIVLVLIFSSFFLFPWA